MVHQSMVTLLQRGAGALSVLASFAVGVQCFTRDVSKIVGILCAASTFSRPRALKRLSAWSLAVHAGTKVCSKDGSDLFAERKDFWGMSKCLNAVTSQHKPEPGQRESPNKATCHSE